ncbi:MAG TPA: LOG family protein [bacterium]|nr:LOG family protein [bacterium]HPQ67081.1 LOG family protein [bacterium]
MTARVRTVGVFGSAVSREGTEEYEEAVRAGAAVARAGFDLVCGGYGGSMEAVSRGCAEAGGSARGIGLDYFSSPPNRFLGRFEHASTLGRRLDRFVEDADLFLALPGGIGTVAEVMFVWDLVKSGRISGKPVILYGRSWERLLAVLEESFVIPSGAFAAMLRAPDLAALEEILRKIG